MNQTICKVCGQPASKVKNDANGRLWVYCVPCGIHYRVKDASPAPENKAPETKAPPIPESEFAQGDNVDDEATGESQPDVADGLHRPR